MKYKTLNVKNTEDAKKKIPDIEFWGDGDTWKLICKASSESQGWMKSTKAMEVGLNVIIQVSTQQRNPDGTYVIAEALTTILDAKIEDVYNYYGGLTLVGRKIVQRDYDYED